MRSGSRAPQLLPGFPPPSPPPTPPAVLLGSLGGLLVMAEPVQILRAAGAGPRAAGFQKAAVSPGSRSAFTGARLAFSLAWWWIGAAAPCVCALGLTSRFNGLSAGPLPARLVDSPYWSRRRSTSPGCAMHPGSAVSGGGPSLEVVDSVQGHRPIRSAEQCPIQPVPVGISQLTSTQNTCTSPGEPSISWKVEASGGDFQHSHA